jgi:mannose-6-phosphate isomerase-like protein (cupin superfamily)
MTASTECTVFKYQKKDSDRKRVAQVLCRSDVLFGAVSVIRSGGENNLHSHAKLDGFWFVLRGAARFYTTDDELLAELGPEEGILIPRGYPYWFESIGSEVLELLQVEASTQQYDSLDGFSEDRTDYTPPKSSSSEVIMMNGDVVSVQVPAASDGIQG